ncbi:hypothetical protein OPV22_016533 [Ensete ventricosum]|uniref:Uncharacterized protein n=1 Tax=Ensete ventricosum TaxID=4639 RepID=A0AAV8QV84_ENSVE|nr:hypothetical protein OPV22_016533 [Ensete ventricosum]
MVIRFSSVSARVFSVCERGIGLLGFPEAGAKGKSPSRIKSIQVQISEHLLSYSPVKCLLSSHPRFVFLLLLWSVDSLFWFYGFFALQESVS